MIKADTIPKVIHYCWFGGAALPPLAQRCIASWKKYLPEYEIREWNESNFDVHSCRYAEEAYNAKKWAFVSDYARLSVLNDYGGIYMDTDVEVVRPLDRFLVPPAFSGFEDDVNIPTGVIGAQKANRWIVYLLSYYDNKTFVNPDGGFDMTTNVTTITEMTKEKYLFVQNNTYQELDNDVVIYPKDFFCPKDYQTGKITITNNTYSIHHFAASWVAQYNRAREKIYKTMYRLFGKCTADSIRRVFGRKR